MDGIGKGEVASGEERRSSVRGERKNGEGKVEGTGCGKGKV
jgi:hypothetical protein